MSIWPAMLRRRRAPSDDFVSSQSSTIFGCWGGIAEFFQKAPSEEVQRKEFEQVVSFLSSIPLFKTRLPRSELPKVAMLLEKRERPPGQCIVKQGSPGRGFFLIQSGEAAVITKSTKDGSVRTRAVLQAGDYFGGHTLTADRCNIATVVSRGPSPLVTLSMSRATFEKSGIQQMIRFPKRPAIYDDAETLDSFNRDPISEEEQAFVCDAMQSNTNLRALIGADLPRLKSIARSAVRRDVAKGDVIAKAGEICQEFLIVQSGSFAVEPLKVDAEVVHSKMASRVLRKQSLIRELSRPPLAAGTRSILPIEIKRLASSPVEHAEENMPSTRVERNCSWSCVGGDDSTRSNASMMMSPPARVERYCSWSYVGGDESTKSNAVVNTSPRLAPTAEVSQSTVFYGRNASFGEMSLLYNTRWWSDFKANEDSVVYALGRSDFRRGFRRTNHKRFHEYRELLDEVVALDTLVSSERWELACSASGLVDFKPGEQILEQGKFREARQWYVVFSGSGVMSHMQKDESGELRRIELGVLTRGIHFGERSLLRGDSATQISVDAGEDGMCCLTFDFELTRVLLERLFKVGDDLCPSVFSDIHTWCKTKAKGWQRDASNSTVESKREQGFCKALKLKDLGVVSILGKGSYGVVKLVQNSRHHNKQYALKAVSRKIVMKNHAQRHIKWERELLSMLDSPFIIRLYKTFRDRQYVYFLLEAMLGGNLLELLHCRSEVFTEDVPRGSSAAFYSACLIAGIEHMHERNIVHRDLKPENVFLNLNGYAKLGDLGFARFVLHKTNTLVGTPDYMAPEMIDFPHTHDSSVDWWAIGVVHYELLTGEHPFEDDGLCDQMARLMAIRRSQKSDRLGFPFGFPMVAQDFVRGLLQKLPHRLGAATGAAEVCSHFMYQELGFDWRTFRAQMLPSPCSQAKENAADINSSTDCCESTCSSTAGPSDAPPEISPGRVTLYYDEGEANAATEDDCSDWDLRF